MILNRDHKHPGDAGSIGGFIGNEPAAAVFPRTAIIRE
jgi:hypothetical protein